MVLRQVKKPSSSLGREIFMFVLFAFAVFLAIALASYSKTDTAWSYRSAQEGGVTNAGGVTGAWLSDIVLSLFGIMAYALPLLILYFAWTLYKDKNKDSQEKTKLIGLRTIGFVLMMIGGCAIAYLFYPHLADLPQDTGGILGSRLSIGTFNTLGKIGTALLYWTSFLIGFTLFARISWFRIADFIGAVILGIWQFGLNLVQKIKNFLVYRHAKKDKEKREVEVHKMRDEQRKRERVKIEKEEQTIQESTRKLEESQGDIFGVQSTEATKTKIHNTLPVLSLLNPKQDTGNGYSTEVLQAMSRQVELKLKDFNVLAEVVAVKPGPVVTRFELIPAPGVKASRISSLATDLARSLSLTSVRVVEVIPGKAVIGLEVPNETREIVYLSEIIGSTEYENSKMALCLALGKDIAGSPAIADLAKMPHLLVAGTTGSGKSVCVNSIILSILYRSTADDVRLIMVDPKMLELSIYEGIPHLLAPVVTDMNDAANALRWSVAEMERRYKLMSAMGVRNIAGFNRKIVDAKKADNPILDPLAPEDTAPEELEKMPFIVVIIDEFADMIMAVGKKVEELIVRLAQKARASGIHLVLATQRPSVDVITGLIKSNVPSRIAFHVSSKMDSRVILDQMGAENLLGKGDMLYLAPGQAFPERVHGAYVDDNEVHRVVEYLKEHSEENYVEGVLSSYTEASDASLIPGAKPAASSVSGEADPLYDEAVDIVLKGQKASISGLQRRLRVGYNRAARLIETMEEAGLVSAVGPNGQREVIVKNTGE